ncbi:hypothetical protein [Croceicoccus hydrothermalis]|uniref:hypothetical protein n=1 Tax=Croceicoccus hydrothermalis TaxID=2867964 RepID=UPI001EFBDCDB|nr:hypothetical protein [Croceicoccus hydrothermalis]
MMRSVFDMGHSHFDIGSPSSEHNENFSERRKGQVQLEFGQFFNDLHDLNRLWTVRDIGGQTAPLRLVVRIFFVQRDFVADTRGFATAATGFGASVAGFRARIMSSFAQSAWLRSLKICKNAKSSLVF